MGSKRRLTQILEKRTSSRKKVKTQSSSFNFSTFHWLGNATEDENGENHYESFNYRNEKFQIFDFAVFQDDSSKLSLICCIKDMKQTDEVELEVELFCKAVDAELSKSGLQTYSTNEVFYLAETRTINPSFIIHKCEVKGYEQFMLEFPEDEPTLDQHFYCRSNYNRSTKRVGPMTFSFDELTDDSTANSPSYSDKENTTKHKRRPAKKITGKKQTIEIVLPSKVFSHKFTEIENVKKALHVSFIPKILLCRETEYTEIYSSLHAAVSDKQGSCIYISGVPGTGKTCTVKECVRNLKKDSEAGETPNFEYLEINGMKITEPTQCYSILWEKISGKKMTNSHALDLLEKYFSKSQDSNKRPPIVLLLDELDVLVTKKQTVMYNFFEWPNRPSSNLIVIAIANTMDLPERMMTARISSRMGMNRINFQPYSYQQLDTIIKARLEGFNGFESDAVQFCSRKIGAVSGDARRALDVCRRAIEIAEQEKVKVSLKIVDRTIKEMFSSPSVQSIQNASLHQKIFLLSLIYKIRSTGLCEVEYGQIAENHFNLCRVQNIEPPSWGDISFISNSLCQMAFLKIEKNSTEIFSKVRLNILEHDVETGLKNDPSFAKFL